MRSIHLLGALSLLSFAACGGTSSKPAVVSTAAEAITCALSTEGSALAPIGDYRVSGTVALAKHGSRNVALVADEDARAILVIDVDAGHTLSTTLLDGIPSQLMVLSDGRVAVTLRDRASLALFEASKDATAPLRPRCAVDTPTDPVALAATPDDAVLLVTSGWGQTLTTFQSKDLSTLAKIELAREPRAVVVADDGKRAFISHAVGSAISVVDLEHHRRLGAISMIVDPHNASEGRRDLVGKVIRTMLGHESDDPALVPGRNGLRAGCQGYALAKSVEPRGRILAPQVLVDPGDPEGQSAGYGNAGMPTELVNVAVVDEDTQSLAQSSVDLNNIHHKIARPDQAPERECLLPRAAAVDAESRSLLVACYGTGQVVAYDSSSANPGMVEKASWKVGAGPSGLRVDGENRRAIVWSQFDRNLNVVPLGNMQLTDEHAADAPKVVHIAAAPSDRLPSYEFRLGRQLFHAVGDTRISNDGRACASCHPDGRDDAITWATPEGPRRTAFLAGRLKGSAPYAWNGINADVEKHVTHTFERLNGQGLQGMELQALVSYIQAMSPPTIVESPNSDLVARGRKIFDSKEAACASCHATDGLEDGQNHDVGSAGRGDKGREFNTPSLAYLSGRAPYFHDGRYRTLTELLRESDGRMGHTAHLAADDLKALEAFLNTL